MRLKLQAEHRKKLREFDKKIVAELDEKVVCIQICFINNSLRNYFLYLTTHIKKLFI